MYCVHLRFESGLSLIVANLKLRLTLSTPIPVMSPVFRHPLEVNDVIATLAGSTVLGDTTKCPLDNFTRDLFCGARGVCTDGTRHRLPLGSMMSTCSGDCMSNLMEKSVLDLLLAKVREEDSGKLNGVCFSSTESANSEGLLSVVVTKLKVANVVEIHEVICHLGDFSVVHAYIVRLICIRSMSFESKADAVHKPSIRMLLYYVRK